MTEPNMRLLSRIYNRSRWERGQAWMWKIGDWGIPEEPFDAEDYHRRCRRFPRRWFHSLGDFFELQDQTYHNKWANRPMGEWPRNRKIKKPTHPAGRNFR